MTQNLRERPSNIPLNTKTDTFNTRTTSKSQPLIPGSPSQAETGCSYGSTHMQVPLQPSPRMAFRSPLRQEMSTLLNPSIASSSKRSSNATSTPPPPSPSFPPPTSPVTNTPPRVSWLSGVSSLSLPQAHSLHNQSSPAASSRLSLSTTGDNSGGGTGGTAANSKSSHRKTAVSAPFMFPIRTAPSPTHSVSVLSPALLDVPFSPGRSAPTPVSSMREDRMNSPDENMNGSTSTITGPGNMSTGGIEISTSKRNHTLWPSAWGFSRAVKKFQNRRHQRHSSSPTPLEPYAYHNMSAPLTATVSVTPMPQAAPQCSTPTVSHPEHRSALGVRKSLKNMRGMFRTATGTGVPPLPHNSVSDIPVTLATSPPTDTRSESHSPQVTATPRHRNGGERNTNKMLSVVGELGEACLETPGVGGEGKESNDDGNANRLSSIHPALRGNQRKDKGLDLGSSESRDPQMCASPTIAVPARKASIRRNSVVGYIYPCNKCARSWLEECAHDNAGRTAETMGEEPRSGAGKVPTKSETPPIPPPQAPIPHLPRRNSQFAEMWESSGTGEAGQPTAANPQPLQPDIHQDRSFTSTPKQPFFASLGKKSGRRGLSADFGTVEQRRSFSWSTGSPPTAAQPTTTPTPSHSPTLRTQTSRQTLTTPTPSATPTAGPPPRVTRPPVNQVSRTSPTPQLHSPPSSPKAAHFTLPPAASAVLGIPPTATLLSSAHPRRPRTVSANHPQHHKRQISSSSTVTAAGSGTPLCLWTSRPNSESSDAGMIVVDRAGGGLSGRGRVSLRSVASTPGSGIAPLGGGGAGSHVGEKGGEVDEEMMDGARERERMRRGLVALGLLEGGAEGGEGEKGEPAGRGGGQGTDVAVGEVSVSSAEEMGPPQKEPGWRGSLGRAWRR